jgi:predicted phosphodiesterase
MKIQLMSDLHFEFGRSVPAFLEGQSADPDVLVLAGDIESARFPSTLRLTLQAFCAKFRRVVYVPGNHEYYKTDAPEAHRLIVGLAKNLPNLTVLDCCAAEIEGRRFLGGSLWFRRHVDVARYREALNDFSLIGQFEPWVYEENERCIAFLERELRAGDIVVTHHLPSQRSVAPQFKGSPINMFFVCDVEPLILQRKPALWMHGHTHVDCDYTLGETRVVCNPLGYPRTREGNFNPGLLLGA